MCSAGKYSRTVFHPDEGYFIPARGISSLRGVFHPGEEYFIPARSIGFGIFIITVFLGTRYRVLINGVLFRVLFSVLLYSIGRYRTDGSITDRTGMEATVGRKERIKEAWKDQRRIGKSGDQEEKER